MPSLKDLRNRIDSVKSTKKITQAMKMVAASKLKKAQIFAEKGRSYSSGLDEIVKGLVSSIEGSSHPLLKNKNDIKNALLIVVSSDRGLCGGLNSNITKKVKKLISSLEVKNKNVSITCIGKKGFDLLSSLYKKNFNFEVNYMPISDMDYSKTESFVNRVIASIYSAKYEECYLFYNYFKSVIAQEVKLEKLMPYEKSEEVQKKDMTEKFFEYEPDEEEVLSKILPKNFIVQVYKAILESRASEQGARMTAMDNATRNAGDMIDNLSLSYNRQRQALITKELIEIISGAEAL